MTTKKVILGLVLVLSFLFTAASQDIQFLDLTDLPNERGALTSANDGEHIYIVNGFGINEQIATDIFKFDIAENSWTTLTSATAPKRFASAAIAGDHLYVFNGVTDGGALFSGVEKIDLNDGTIELLSNNPQPARAAGVASWNGKIYSFGGTTAPGVYTDKFYEFDPQTDTWTELADIPFAGETKGEIVNGKLYMVGGFNGSVSDQIYIYDFATNSWEINIEMPFGISAHATALIGDRIYIVGDFSNLTLTAYFDTTDDSFQVLTSNLKARRHCAAEGINGSLYAVGGNTNSSITSAIASIQRTDLITSSTDIFNSTRVEIFPNPATDILYIDTPFDELIIHNAQGQEIIRSANTRQIVISELSSGTYFVQISIDQEIFHSRLIKQ